MQVDWVNNNSRIITEPFYFLKIDRDEHALPQGLGSPMLATCQLLLLRDVYRQGWKPDWTVDDCKYCIGELRNNIIAINSNIFSEIWSFKDIATRDAFLENFKPLLEEHYKLYA